MKEEFTQGFEDDQRFKDLLHTMDVGKDDLNLVFTICDDDESGDISYLEFIKELHNLKSRDSHTMLTFIKFGNKFQIIISGSIFYQILKSQ